MHDVFHVSCLKPYVGTKFFDVLDQQQLDVVDEAEVIQPEQILLHRWKHSFDRVLPFFERGKNQATHFKEHTHKKAKARVMRTL